VRALSADSVPAAASARARAWFYARLALTLGAFAALFHYVSPADMLAAARRIPAQAWALCVALALASQVFSVVRFQLLLDAYGADRKPRWAEALRLFLVSSFYNTYVPGGVAGDVVRAVAVRDSFTHGGLTSALAVSLVERVTGVAGMLLLIASVSIVRPIAGMASLLPFSVLGLLAAAGAVIAVVLGRRFAHWLPGRLRELAASLPQLRSLPAYFLAVGSAFTTHAIGALGYHAIIRSLSAQASVAESLVIVPLAQSAMYIPATIAGAGTRDAAFVFLYRRVGVAAPDALAMSLAVLMVSLLIALLGGIANLLGPYDR
jgi:uncharacterized membrane protein YbhN (UPF0104 family)